MKRTAKGLNFAMGLVTATTLLLLSACGGDDGKDGEPGKPGPVGLDIAQATSLNIELENPMIEENTISVDLVLTNANGVPVTGLESFADANIFGLGIAKLVPQGGKGYKTPQWISYINAMRSPDAARTLTNFTYTENGQDVAVNFTPGDAIQAGIESGCGVTCVTVVDPGVYRYTFETKLDALTEIDDLDLSYDPTLVHRITLEFQANSDREKLVNAHIDFIPEEDFRTAEPEETRTVVSIEDNCVACHNTNYADTSATAKPLLLHGGRRYDTANCQMCHNSYSTDPETGSSLDLAAMVHEIHKGDYIMVGRGTIHDFSGAIAKAANDPNIGYPLYRDGQDVSEKVTLPVDIGNCQSCHSTDGNGPADATAFMHHRGLACASCHMTGFNPIDNPEFLTPPAGQKDRGYVGNYFHYYSDPATDGIPGADVTGVFNSGGCGSCHAEEDEQGSAQYHLAKANINQSLREKYTYSIGNGTFDAATGELNFIVDWSSDVAPQTDPNVKEFWVSLTAFDGTEFTMGPRPSSGALGRSESRISVNLAGVDTNANLTAAANGSAITYTLTGITITGGTSPEPYSQIVNLGQGFMDGKLLICANSDEIDPTADAAIDCSDTTATISEVIVGSNKASFSSTGDAIDSRPLLVSEAKCANCHGEQADFSQAHSGTRGDYAPDNSCGTCHSAIPNTAVALADGSCVTCHNGAPAHSIKPFERGFDFKVMIHEIHADTRSQRRTTTEGITFPENPANCAACHDDGQISLSNLANKPAFMASNGEFSPIVAACASCHAPTRAESASTVSHFEGNGGVYEGTSGTYQVGDETCALCHDAGKSAGFDSNHPIKW
ncbi:OmcA/MtrC family decaheme c-type cytochrome [Shewanella sp. Isolate11]|uniref:OmcA/MtrC family decaheme c-type cytochrome n=1 Tax=Shewanella sp. Isolate11 TaxID=2908530 RepID=UPI001EFD6B54|nr:OmcA/MtrC family decaheme c-type cytochrome [Shewanella sp. Isolate11]MCG9696210.1 OmcA/MtrC family decaheme c-type cytochrome [Shewanella sp. Isolate11]